MAEVFDPWPDWRKPATKGDIVRALVGVRSCVIDIQIALAASQRGDLEKVAEMIGDLRESDKKLQEVIDDIGGRQRDV